jgi:malonyl-CoA O-methyltransferase
MRVKEAYDEWSSSYDDDRNLTRDLDHQVTREMLSGFRCDSIIELGCGT